MAYLGISATSTGLTTRRGSGDVAEALGQGLARIPASAPVVILVHGYKFDPLDPRTDPHGTLYSFTPATDGWKIRSWPLGLGFSPDSTADGLCIGFAWPASAPNLASLLRTGRSGFARIYDAAPEFGCRLAELINLIGTVSPGRRVDLLAHSLGARVALTSLPQLATGPGRIILLGAAEFQTRAVETLERVPQRAALRIYNVTARANDPYDAMFEVFAPRERWRERAIGHGLGARSDFWLDLQIDRDDVTNWINQRGIPLSASRARFCHWSFYTRRGAFLLYQAILRRQPGWDMETLRRVPCLAVQEPRWSRFRMRARHDASHRRAPGNGAGILGGA